jgi:hypothetical protein
VQSIYNSGKCWTLEELRFAELLGESILGIGGRKKRGVGTSINPATVDGRYTPRTNERNVALST